MNDKIEVLLIEDDRADALIVQRSLEKFSDTEVSITHVLSLADAMNTLQVDMYDVVLLDLNLPDARGMETINRCYEYFQKIPFILLTGLDDDDVGMAAIKIGVQDYLVKGAADQHAVRKSIWYAIERFKQKKELQSLALVDELTGVYNRRGFEEQLAIINASVRNAVILYVDLDYFKDINDSHGHLEGDNALQCVASVLKNNFRKGDIVSRFGGDEFVMCAFEATEAAVDVIVRRVHEGIAAAYLNSDKGYKLSVSVGIAFYHRDKGKTISEVIQEADQNMYMDKEKKKEEKSKIKEDES